MGGMTGSVSGGVIVAKMIAGASVREGAGLGGSSLKTIGLLGGFWFSNISNCSHYGHVR